MYGLKMFPSKYLTFLKNDDSELDKMDWAQNFRQNDLRFKLHLKW